MTIKNAFKSDYSDARKKGDYSLEQISAQSPVSYSADLIAAIIKQSREKYSAKKARIIDDSNCDFFVFCSGNSATGVYVVEQKTKSIKDGRVEMQLQGGADFVSEHLEEHESFDFLPVLIAKKMKKIKHAKMKRETIVLGKKKRKIVHIRRNAPLKKIV